MGQFSENQVAQHATGQPTLAAMPAPEEAGNSSASSSSSAMTSSMPYESPSSLAVIWPDSMACYISGMLASST